MLASPGQQNGGDGLRGRGEPAHGAVSADGRTAASHDAGWAGWPERTGYAATIAADEGTDGAGLWRWEEGDG